MNEKSHVEGGVSEGQQPAEKRGDGGAGGGGRARAVSPLNGQPVPGGRKAGTPNKVTRTIREAVEAASQPGGCHPQGLAGWLIERAQGGVEDRKIFANLVGKVIPAQVKTSVEGGVVVQLPWLSARRVGGTPLAQSAAVEAQVIEIAMDSHKDLRVQNPRALVEPVEVQQNQGLSDMRRGIRESTETDPHPPVEAAAGGGAGKGYTPPVQNFESEGVE